MKPTLLYTIGYQSRSMDALIKTLHDNDIFTVIDVREVAWSRKPGFSKKQFGDALGGQEIAYFHAGYAGNPRQLRAQSTTLAEQVAKFRTHLEEHPKIVDDLHALIHLHVKEGHSVALVAFPLHPDDCHRKLLAEELGERYGYFVEHLMPVGCERAVEKAAAVAVG